MYPEMRPARSKRSMFLREFMRSPRSVGAVMPSGDALARRMIEGVGPHCGPIVELGPGTGVFTRALLAKGTDPKQLILIEADPNFARHLKAAFPGVTVVNGDACEIGSILAGLGQPQVRHMISGLPFRNFDKRLQGRLVDAIGQVLPQSGSVKQFTYALQPPFDPDAAHAAGLAGQRKAFVAANLPPAFVWHYIKAH